MFDEITKELTSPDIQNLAFQRLCDSKLQTSSRFTSKFLESQDKDQFTCRFKLRET
jgi:hypothetical protein